MYIIYFSYLVAQAVFIQCQIQNITVCVADILWNSRVENIT